MHTTLLFIHGMFVNSKSWERWIPFFEQRGFHCLAPSWPLHEGEPAELRDQVPEGLGELSLEEVVDHYATIAAAEGERPILIGHSLGGLVAQVLLSRDLGSAAVCLSSVAPNRLLALDWDFLMNSAAIANPLKGNAPAVPTLEAFHHNFAATLTADEARVAYETYIVPESRNVLRDSVGRLGQIAVDEPHGPLLFVAGDRDHIIPDSLSRRNASAYTDAGSISDFQDFAGRGHFLFQEPGWQEVASFIEGWLVANVVGDAPIGFTLR